MIGNVKTVTARHLRKEYATHLARYFWKPYFWSRAYGIERWHDYIGEATLADAILDRLLHGAHRLELRGESMRKLAVELTDRDRSA